MLAPHFTVTSSLLGGEDIGHGGFDAVVIAADLKAVENISALKEVFPKFKNARQRVFVINQKECLLVFQAYALGATHVLTYSAAMFHDIGKATIPLAVLDKPGKLDPHERALIETHPVAGYDILKQTSGISPEILDAVRHHHEYFDGSGYPDALCAASISDVVRILTISDIFAALIEDRRYKPPMPRDRAYEIICNMRGKLEAPLVVAFKEVALSR